MPEDSVYGPWPQSGEIDVRNQISFAGNEI